MNRVHLAALALCSASLAPAFAQLATPKPPALPSTPEPASSAKLSPAAAAKAKELKAKAIAFLRSKQDAATGAWGVKDGVAPFPGYTGLVITGFAMQSPTGKLSASDIAKDTELSAALSYLLKAQMPDGGIYNKALPSYNTAICLSALTHFDTPESKAAIAKAVPFLKSLQYSETAVSVEGLPDTAAPVDKSNAYYGGWGYGRSGRPDLSNTQWAMDALVDCGIPSDDPALQRALVFIKRCQMAESVNTEPYAKGSKQGGFIYATSENKDKVGSGQSQIGTIEETLDDGTKVSRLRCYGSMTYAGFKGLLYAGLKKDSPEVKLALEWIQKNYTVAENPGAGTDGLYYYYVTFARALSASGLDLIPAAPIDPATLPFDPSKTADPSKPPAPAAPHNWREDLITRLAELQEPDGSFKPFKDRWLETDPVLITAYSLIALQHATK